MKNIKAPFIMSIINPTRDTIGLLKDIKQAITLPNVVTGTDSDGNRVKFLADENGKLEVNTTPSPFPKTSILSPYGDTLSAERIREAHAHFVYPQSGANINSDMYEVIQFNPGAPADNATVNIVSTRMVEVYSGQAGNATGSVFTTGSINTVRRARVTPGAGLTCRVSPIFDTPNAFTDQLLGMGTSEDSAVIGFPAFILTTQGNPNPLSFAVGRTSFVTGTVVGTYVTQENFNIDKLDGTGPSKIVYNPAFGNVFQIDYQTMGFGNTYYYIQNPQTGLFVPFHILEYANLNTQPAQSNVAGFSLFAYTRHSDFSATPAPGVTLRVNSMVLYQEQDIILYGPRNSFQTTDTAVTTSIVMGLRVSTEFPIGSGFINNQSISLVNVTVAKSGGNRTGVFTIVKNPATLTGPTWTTYAVNRSMVETDITATAFTGGQQVGIALVAPESSAMLTTDNLNLVPGDVIIITFSTTGTASDATAAVNWVENF